jgi:predicted Zn-dependent protease
MSRNLAGYIFISLLLNDASGTLAVLVTNANSLKELSYSRELEHQADMGGYQLLRSVYIGPDGMLKLFKTLNAYQNKVAINVPQFISTHPLTEERISYIHETLKKDKTSYPEREDLKAIWHEMKTDDE